LKKGWRAPAQSRRRTSATYRVVFQQKLHSFQLDQFANGAEADREIAEQVQGAADDRVVTPVFQVRYSGDGKQTLNRYGRRYVANTRKQNCCASKTMGLNGLGVPRSRDKVFSFNPEMHEPLAL